MSASLLLSIQSLSLYSPSSLVCISLSGASVVPTSGGSMLVGNRVQHRLVPVQLLLNDQLHEQMDISEERA